MGMNGPYGFSDIFICVTGGNKERRISVHLKLGLDASRYLGHLFYFIVKYKSHVPNAPLPSPTTSPILNDLDNPHILHRRHQKMRVNPLIQRP